MTQPENGSIGNRYFSLLNYKFQIVLKTVNRNANIQSTRATVITYSVSLITGRSNIMNIKFRFIIVLFVMLCVDLLSSHGSFSQNIQNLKSNTVQKKLAIDQAIMCEEIKDFTPPNPLKGA